MKLDILFKPIGTVIVPATKKFVVREKFVENMSRGASARISIGSEFKEMFFRRVERGGGEKTLRYVELTSCAYDHTIMAKLGDTKETALSQIYTLIKRQKKCKSGVLLTDGRSNIFYVRHKSSEFCVVDVGTQTYLDGLRHWCINAFYVAGHPGGWFRDDRLFFSPVISKIRF